MRPQHMPPRQRQLFSEQKRVAVTKRTATQAKLMLENPELRQKVSREWKKDQRA